MKAFTRRFNRSAIQFAVFLTLMLPTYLWSRYKPNTPSMVSTVETFSKTIKWDRNYLVTGGKIRAQDSEEAFSRLSFQ